VEREGILVPAEVTTKEGSKKMLKRGKSGNGRNRHAGVGMETWKLAAIVAVCIALAVMGGLTFNLLPSPTAQAEIDLGFDAPGESPGATEQNG
jgi:hypothetical protein